MLTDEYIAGFFDGEGSIGVYLGGGRTTWHLRTQLTQLNTPTSLALLTELRDRFGGNIGNAHTHRKNYGINWQLNGDRAGAFLSVIRPYAVLKSAQIDEALAFLRSERRGKTGEPFAIRLRALKHDGETRAVS